MFLCGVGKQWEGHLKHIYPELHFPIFYSYWCNYVAEKVGTYLSMQRDRLVFIIALTVFFLMNGQFAGGQTVPKGDARVEDQQQVIVYSSQGGGSVNCPTMCGYYYLYFPTTSVLFTGPLIQVGPIWFSPKSNNAAAVKKAINAAFLAAGFTNYVSDVLDRNDSFYNVNLYIDLNLLYQATGLSRLTLPYYQNGAWQFPNVKTDLQSAVNYPVLWEDTTQVKLPIIYSSQVQSLSSLLCKGAQSDTLYVHNIGTRTLIVSSVGIVSQNGNGSFSLPNMSFPDSISPGDSIPFIMQFIPSSVGIETGVLSINS